MFMFIWKIQYLVPFVGILLVFAYRKKFLITTKRSKLHVSCSFHVNSYSYSFSFLFIVAAKSEKTIINILISQYIRISLVINLSSLAELAWNGDEVPRIWRNRMCIHSVTSEIDASVHKPLFSIQLKLRCNNIWRVYALCNLYDSTSTGVHSESNSFSDWWNCVIHSKRKRNSFLENNFLIAESIWNHFSQIESRNNSFLFVQHVWA